MNRSEPDNQTTTVSRYKFLRVSSPAFKEGEMIPSEYTCDGDNISPPLDILHIPRKTKCLALVVDDPDAPGGNWVHWVVWNIPVTHHLRENEVYGVEGFNDFEQHHYGGPCPPRGVHRYFFKVYALENSLNLSRNANKRQLEAAMRGHILAFGELSGLYQRKQEKS